MFMENLINIVLAILCVSIPVGVLVASAILGVKSRKRYAARIQEKIDSGHFGNWPKSSILNRRKMIARILIVLLSCIPIIFIIWIAFPSEETRIALAIVFGVLAVAIVILGLIMMLLLERDRF
jgi:hypothetical protein